VQVLFHCLQTQAGVFSDLFVAMSLARELHNLSFPACKPGESRQMEKLWPTKHGGISVEIFSCDQKMWSRNPRRFDLSYLNCCSQTRCGRVLRVFLYKFCLSSRVNL